MKHKPDLSIIIVNYKVEKELINCIISIIKSKPNLSYEIVVVDNGNEMGLGNKLKGKFSIVRYVKSNTNLGFGGGNNLGARIANGKYLFFLNPDTQILENALENLHRYIANNKNVGIVSPVILDQNLKQLGHQGSGELTPKSIIFSQSFLRKIFPKKNIYNKISSDIKDESVPIITKTVPGAAMMVRTELFRKVNGFDEKLFLYFEENDLSKRIINLGYRLFIIPSAKIIHLIGCSTRKIPDMEEIYSKSRFRYLKKHYGIFNAVFTQMLLSINKNSIVMLLILLIASFLRIINIENTMSFIGDQGWFYLPARDMILNGQIPLVGIASSHPWLHQGPLWTYMLASIFWAFGFNPVNGAYLTIILGVITVLMVYVVGKELFSVRLGIISALFYATSPLVIVHSRTPYHTSPIPLFTLLFILSLSRWIKGNKMSFPLSVFFLAILYNLELATSLLWFVLLSILLFGIWKKNDWINGILKKKILFYSATGLVIPMIPILIYDFGHGFPQTVKFTAWMGYRILRFFGLPGLNGHDVVDYSSILTFSLDFYKKLIFAKNNIVALTLLVLSFLSLFIGIYRINKKTKKTGFALLALWILIPLIGYLLNRIPSEAYLPIFFPGFIFLLVYFFDIIGKVKFLKIPVIIVISLLISSNAYYSFSQSISTNNLGISKRISVSREIVDQAKGRQYTLLGIGEGDQFESFTMNYQYLTWWLGHEPAKTPQKLIFTINEGSNNIAIFKNE